MKIIGYLKFKMADPATMLDLGRVRVGRIVDVCRRFGGDKGRTGWERTMDGHAMNYKGCGLTDGVQEGDGGGGMLEDR